MNPPVPCEICFLRMRSYLNTGACGKKEQLYRILCGFFYAGTTNSHKIRVCQSCGSQKSRSDGVRTGKICYSPCLFSGFRDPAETILEGVFHQTISAALRDIMKAGR